MRFIPTRVHALLDWPIYLFLIALPWVLGFANGGPEQWVPVAVGASGLLVTFFTDHETGVVKRLPMSAHNALDVLSSALLAASPWLFGFADRVSQPHLLLGVMGVALGLFTSNTRTVSYRQNARV